jgi:hypothetical protein
VHSGEFLSGEGEELLLQHLQEQERSNYARNAFVAPASLNAVAQSGPPVPDDLVDQQQHEVLVRRFAQSINRDASQPRHDAWSFDKIFEVRRLLISQLNTPDVECKRRLKEIKAAYPEAADSSSSSAALSASSSG